MKLIDRIIDRVNTLILYAMSAFVYLIGATNDDWSRWFFMAIALIGVIYTTIRPSDRIP